MWLFSQQTRQMTEESFKLHDGKRRRRYLTAAERDAFIDAAHDAAAHKRTLCLVLAHTGCLIMEAIALTAGDVDVSGEAIFFGRRDGHERAVPVPAAVMHALDVIHGVRRAQQQSDAGQSVRLWPVDRSTASRWIDRIMKDADIFGPQAGPRGLRYGFMVEKLQEGFPVETVQRWLGNKARISLAVYEEAVNEGSDSAGLV
jgi:integrase